VATGGETSKSGADSNGATLSYTPGKEQVFLNGSLLVRSSDYTATDGSSITGLTALVVSDILEVLSFSPFNVANAVQASNFAAKGDLVAGTAAGTFTNLTVGNNGEALLADSTTSTGLRWQPSAPAGKNAVINGGMDIWQRGTSVALAASTAYTSGYNADRWDTGTSTNQAITISRQSTNDTTNLPNIQYCMRYQRNSGQTGVSGLSLANSFETANSIPFAGKSVTLSFYARAGANYSSASNLLGASLYTGTGTDQNRLAVVYTGDANPISSNSTLTTTWQRFSYSATVASTATELSVVFSYTPVGTAGANDYFEITGVQLELGSVATTFSRAGGTLQGELAACQRYYWQSASGSSNYFWGGQSLSGSYATVTCKLPVTMRVSPTVTLTSQDNSGFAATAGSVIRINPDSFSEQRTSNATVGSAYFGSSVVATAEL
jgi:hypothetical protein